MNLKKQRWHSLIKQANTNTILRKTRDFYYDYFYHSTHSMIKLVYFKYEGHIINNELCKEIEEPVKPKCDWDALTLIKYEKAYQSDNQVKEAIDKICIKNEDESHRDYNSNYPIFSNKNKKESSKVSRVGLWNPSID